MSSSQPREGDQVEIVTPDYLAGKLGIVLCEETLANFEVSGRWLVRLQGSHEVIVSLWPTEFRIASTG